MDGLYEIFVPNSVRTRASRLLEGTYDIRTAQEFLGHNHVKTTMIYTRVLNRGSRGGRRPVDDL